MLASPAGDTSSKINVSKSAPSVNLPLETPTMHSNSENGRALTGSATYRESKGQTCDDGHCHSFVEDCRNTLCYIASKLGRENEWFGVGE